MFILILTLLIIGAGSYFIAAGVYGRLLRNASRWAVTISIITFVMSFAVIAFGVFLLFLFNFPFER